MRKDMIDRKGTNGSAHGLRNSHQTARHPRNRLLKELEVSDNIYSKLTNDIKDNPNDVKLKRRSMSTEKDLSLWNLPETLEDANHLNENIQFLSSTERPSKNFDYDCGKIVIRYQPLKLLNFQRLLIESSSSDYLDQKNERHRHDFDICESEDLINMLDNDSAIPYRSAIAQKKDYSTVKTVPSVQDRKFFQNLLNQSSTARYFNANIFLADHEDETDTTKHIRKRFKKNPSKKHSHTSSIEYIYLRDFEIKTWYTTPYPEEYNRNKILYICEYCLKYMNSRYIYHRHQLKCTYFRPPGNEIYRDGNISIWEIDGRENVIYSQNLCLLAKLFLNSKTLYYDVEPFIFYVLTEREDEDSGTPKFHLVGYFSKEKLNSTDYNLSCILTLPIYQRKGYGHFLMEFSYLLSRREFKWGTPEKPLSDLGLLSYRNYWKVKCAQVLLKVKNTLLGRNNNGLVISLEDISNLTGMIPTDVVFGLEQLRVLVRSRKNDGTIQYGIKIDSWQRIEKLCQNYDKKGYCRLDPTKLVWKPMIFGPSCGVNAVGTMVETTTGATRNTSGINDDQEDFFKKSMSMLVNFMRDDISDPRPMEVAEWQKIEERSKIKKYFDISSNQHNFSDINDWELCYQEPQFRENGNRINDKPRWDNKLKQEFVENNSNPIKDDLRHPRNNNMKKSNEESVGEYNKKREESFSSISEEEEDADASEDEDADANEDGDDDDELDDEDEEEEEEIIDTRRSHRLQHLRKMQSQPIRHHLRGRVTSYDEEI